MRRFGNNLAATSRGDLPLSRQLSAGIPVTKKQLHYLNMITPHRRHVLTSWVVRERLATRFPRRCMLTTETKRQIQAQTM